MSAVNKLMVGVAVGAIIGILYAPDKGSATRNKLSRRGNDLRDRFNRFKVTVRDKIDSLKEDVDDIEYQEMETPLNNANPEPHWQG